MLTERGYIHALFFLDKGASKVNIKDIEQKLPHRPPFLFVDRVSKLEPLTLIEAYKSIAYNEAHLQFLTTDKKAIFPQLLIIEALAQAAGILVKSSAALPNDKVFYYLAGINKTQFFNEVRAGDTLKLRFTLLHMRSQVVKGYGEAFVDGELVCHSNITLMREKSADEAERHHEKRDWLAGSFTNKSIKKDVNKHTEKALI